MEIKRAPGWRLSAIDAVRGAVMILMALDHVRDFFSRSAMSFSPTDLSRTTTALFLTRWITHFCAPAFVFTAGTGAFLWWQHNRTKKQLSVFLLTRGVWLLALELVVMRFSYAFSFSRSNPVFLVVLWVFGACMIAMAALIWLPVGLLGALSLAVIALHDCFDRVNASRFGAAAGAWKVIHQPGAFRLAGHVIIVSYPVGPWLAVMIAGFCFGRVFLMEATRRRRILIATGIAATVGFVVLRAINIYGDPVRWSAQKSALYTALSFLNCTKYPPSLAFLLMTLGPVLLAFVYFERMPLKAANPLLVFGRVPLFYFVLHFYAAHASAAFLSWLRYGRASFAFLFHPLPSMGGPRELFPAGFGYDLWVSYAMWALIVIGLYPVCRWFAGVKARRRDWWLSYL